MKSFTFLLLIAVFLSCTKTESNEIKDVYFFSDEKSKNLDTRKILDIEVKFSECGEWGGHDENMSITIQKDENFYLHYNKYDVDCDNMIIVNDSMGSYNTPQKKIIDSVTIKMNNIHKKSILEFSKTLLEAKFREGFPGNSGNRFHLYKYEGLSGSDFEINFYGYDKILQKSYTKLIKDLGLYIDN